MIRDVIGLKGDKSCERRRKGLKGQLCGSKEMPRLPWYVM